MTDAAVAAVQVGALRVLVADDSFLVRDGVVRMLTAQPGLDVVGATADLAHHAGSGRRAPAGRGAHRHPDAAQPHRRGPAGRRPLPAPAPGDRSGAAQPVRRRRATCARCSTSGTERRGLPAQGAGRRRRRARCARSRPSPPAARRSTPRWSSPWSRCGRSRGRREPGPAEPAGAARCWPRSRRATTNAAIAEHLVLTQRCGGEAHQLDLRQARSDRRSRRPSAGPGGAAVPHAGAPT